MIIDEKKNFVTNKKKRRISHHQELQKNYAALEETINYLSCIINALERLFEPQKTGDRKRKEESQRTGDRRCKEEFQNMGVVSNFYFNIACGLSC